MDNHQYLVDKSFQGLEKRGFKDNPQYIERLVKELDIIKSGDLADFFLNTAFICQKSKSNGIRLGPGRGSAAGSLVCYCLKITEIDPIKHKLVFERFLNPTRISSIGLADIDTDIDSTKRQKVLEEVKKDFGLDKSFQVINHLQWTEKLAIKDLARLDGVSFRESNNVTKAMGRSKHAENVPKVMEFLKRHPFIEKNYKKLVGLIKSYSVHAGAVITLDKPVEYYDSLLKVNDLICLDNDGKTCDALGFLKNDLLGIKPLAVFEDALNLIEEDVKLPQIYDDEEVFKTINKSQLGLFQLGAGATGSVCRMLKPENFEELAAVVALSRPGAKSGGDRERYIDCKHGKRLVSYEHPDLEPILKENYGAIIYQEDVMRIITDFAGLTPADADNIRRGISKKIPEIFEEYYPKFIRGCVSRGIDEEVAIKVWDKIGSSGAYSFNKSHSVAYAMIAYLGGWLKTYYPSEFYIASLNHADGESKRQKILDELVNEGYELANPNINISTCKYAITDNKVYLPLTSIKGVGIPATVAIMENRPFRSFKDFMKHKTSKVNAKIVKALIEAGALDDFNKPRDEMYSIVSGKKVKWDETEKMSREFQKINIVINENLLDKYDLKQIGITKEVKSLASLKENSEYSDFYIKVMCMKFTEKNGYGIAKVSDGFNTLNLTVPRELIERYGNDLNKISAPLFCHVNGQGDFYRILSLIYLDDLEKYEKEISFYTGVAIKKLEKFQKASDIKVGLVRDIHYFKSRKNNDCVRYNVQISENKILTGKMNCVNPPKLLEGDYIYYIDRDNVFLDIVKII
ncbi:DNA polymerase III subunit alpha [Methanobrevibacter sp.]|uniref:DNA polymerase III subunit alpha n=1 Tax=Methanobrevibacter sp. TaxID=66852 RepID=UPI003D7E8B7D